MADGIQPDRGGDAHQQPAGPGNPNQRSSPISLCYLRRALKLQPMNGVDIFCRVQAMGMVMDFLTLTAGDKTPTWTSVPTATPPPPTPTSTPKVIYLV